MKKKAKAKKRLVIGKDFNAWALKLKDGTFEGETVDSDKRPKLERDLDPPGAKFVRVKFVEVE